MLFADNIKATLTYKSHEGRHYWSNMLYTASGHSSETPMEHSNQKIDQKKAAVIMAVWVSQTLPLGIEFMLLLHVSQSVR